MLDSTIIRGPTFGDVTYTSVASGPNVGLVVWVEGGGLCAARISPDGALVDSVPIDVRRQGTTGLVNMRPGVAWGDQRFLVVWTELDAQCDDLAYCAIVSENGSVSQSRLLQDLSGTTQGNCAAAAFDGTNFLAMWLGATDSTIPGAHFSRISPQGAMLDSPPCMVAPRSPVEQNDIALSFHDGKYLAVWTVWDTSGVWGNFILPDGSTPDSVGFPIRGGINANYPSVTHGRKNYVVAWQEWDNDSVFHNSLRLARISDDGEILDPTGVLLDTFSVHDNDVLSWGDTTLVAYISDSIGNHDSLTVMAVRVDTALRRLDSSPIAVSWTETGNTGGQGPATPSLERCGSDLIAAWYQPYRSGSRRGNPITLYRRISTSGQPVDSFPRVASVGTNVQMYPSVSSDGEDFLAAWIDTRRDAGGDHVSLYASRFSAEGTVLDHDATPILGSNWAQPSLACGGGCYLVIWRGGGSVLAARVSTAGALLDTVPIKLSGSDSVSWRCDPSVASADSLFLVAWRSDLDYRIHGVRVLSTGAVLDSTPLLLQKREHPCSYPKMAFDGQNFLVVRMDYLGGSWGFGAVRVNKDGQVVDSTDMYIPGTGSDDDLLTVASGGGVSLVTDNERYVSWLVSAEGVLLDSVSHANSGYTQVCFDGTNFLLLCRGDSAGQLAGMRITPSGVLLDSTPVLLIDSRLKDVSAHYGAGIAANNANVIGLVFQGFEPRPWMMDRIRASTFPTLGIGSQRDDAQPVTFRVQPNPASRLASLSFNLVHAGPVQVTAFDATGRRCASLFSGRMKAGRQTLPLDARRLANGVYFLRLEAGATRHSTRLVVSR
jgi:hypothetical protein